MKYVDRGRLLANSKNNMEQFNNAIYLFKKLRHCLEQNLCNCNFQNMEYGNLTNS